MPDLRSTSHTTMVQVYQEFPTDENTGMNLENGMSNKLSMNNSKIIFPLSAEYVNIKNLFTLFLFAP